MIRLVVDVIYRSIDSDDRAPYVIVKWKTCDLAFQATAIWKPLEAQNTILQN